MILEETFKFRKPSFARQEVMQSIARDHMLPNLLPVLTCTLLHVEAVSEQERLTIGRHNKCLALPNQTLLRNLVSFGCNYSGSRYAFYVTTRKGQSLR